MKKRLIRQIAVIVCMMLVCTAASGCRTNKDLNYLDYQSYPFKASGVLKYGSEEYKVEAEAEKAGDLVLRIKEHEELTGTVFSLIGGQVTVESGGMTVEVNDGGYSAGNGILLSSSMFAIPAGSLSDVGVVEENGVKYSRSTYRVPEGEVTVYTQIGLKYPEKICAVLNGIEFEFDFNL